jgi:hypothetical protein
VTIAAPGVSIYNAYKNGGYAIVSGTSQATPHVAGLAALVWARNPAYTAAQVRMIIEATAQDLGSPARDPLYGWGRIDVLPALGLSRVASVKAASARPIELPAPSERRDAEIAPGRVLVKFQPGVSAASVDQVWSTFAGVSVEGSIGGLGVFKLRVPAGQEWLWVDQLRTRIDVLYAEPDYIIRLYPDPITP